MTEALIARPDEEVLEEGRYNVSTLKQRVRSVTSLTQADWLTPMFSLIAAVLFGSGTTAVRQGLRYLDPQTGSVVSIATTVACLLLIAPWWMQASYWSNPGIWVFAAGGLVHPIFSRLMAYEANKRVGPTVSSAFDGTSPLFAAGMAIAFLDESLTLPIAIGTVLTMGGVMALYWSPSISSRLMQAAALFAVGAAFLRALIGVIGKYGLEMLPSPLMGGFVAYLVSAIAASMILGARHRSNPIDFHRTGLAWFMLSGIISGVAVTCFFYALLYGDVIVVTPIVSTVPLFAMLTAVAFGIDRITGRIVLAVFIVIAGVVVVSFGRVCFGDVC